MTKKKAEQKPGYQLRRYQTREVVNSTEDGWAWRVWVEGNAVAFYDRDNSDCDPIIIDPTVAAMLGTALLECAKEA
jgi:hypothetical protein